MVKTIDSKSFWGSVKAALLNWLKKQSVKAVLKKLAITGGIKGWLIAFVIEELIEEVDERLIEPAIRKIGYKADVYKGSKIYRRVSNAEDVDDWRDAVNDM